MRCCAFVVLTLVSVELPNVAAFSLSFSLIQDGLQQCGEGCDGHVQGITSGASKLKHV